MKKAYILVILLLVFSFAFFSNKGAIGAPVYHEKSLLENYQSKTELSSVNSINKPVAKNRESIEINAKSYLVIDRETGTPIIQKNDLDKLSIASITKLVTALVALDEAKLDDIVNIKGSYSDLPAPKMGLFDTEEISLENLLSGLLINSDNDAAEAIANYVGKGDYKKFVSLMNSKASELGMKNSHFSNAVGLDNMENYSTAWDLGILANVALENDLIRELAQTQEKRVKDISGDITHYLKTTDSLLSDEDVLVYGLKTGETPEALGCLISYAKTKKGHEIVTVVLGSSDRFGETKKLIQWTEKNIEWN